jgi:hypothetical protein
MQSIHLVADAKYSPCSRALEIERHWVKIVHVYITFEVDAINFYDWYRGQAIYRRELDHVYGIKF